MAAPTTPPLRWLIGTELARYREAGGLSRQEAAARVGIAATKLHNYERGRLLIGREDITTMLTAYDAGAEAINRLCSLAERADQARWYESYAPVLAHWLATFVSIEAIAHAEFTFEPTIIPGLLQTPNYAASITKRSGRVREDHGRRFVSARMARARRLTDDQHPLHLHAVITEAALQLVVGDPDVHREQLRHLVETARLPTVTLQVLRLEDGPHTAITGPFVILDFPGDEARSLAYVETQGGALYVQEPDELAPYRSVEADVQQTAADPQTSIDMIESMVK